MPTDEFRKTEQDSFRLLPQGARIFAPLSPLTSLDYALPAPPNQQLPPILSWHRTSRYRQRNYRFNIDDVIGWSEFRVLWELRVPNEIRSGREWQTDPPSPNIIARDSWGNVVKGFSFEPVPHTIALLQPYQTWFYHNVQGMTWRLYLTRPSRIPILKWFLPRIVVEVYAHPTDAVF